MRWQIRQVTVQRSGADSMDCFVPYSNWTRVQPDGHWTLLLSPCKDLPQAATQTDAEPPPVSLQLRQAATQTDPQDPPEPLQLCQAATQTDPEQACQAATQTDSEQLRQAATQTDPEQLRQAATQTDPERLRHAATQTRPELPPVPENSAHVATQTQITDDFIAIVHTASDSGSDAVGRVSTNIRGTGCVALHRTDCM